MPTTQISILMPVKNAAPYLEECLDSILRQDETDWELLAVDDHSDDQSPDILKQYAQADPRIKVFNNEGKGIIDALHLAFAQSEGSFITRMDADDIMTDGKLSGLSGILTAHGRGHVATGLVKVFPEAGLQDGYRKYEQWLNELTREQNNYKAIYRECVIPSPCWMVCREDLLKCGAFDLDIYPEDYDLAFRFYQHGLKVISCREVLHWWRDHPERASRNDPHYMDQTFFDLKLRYFLEIDHHRTGNLYVWGAGRKGKSLARVLLERKVDFGWVCGNSRKAGNEIYGMPVMHYTDMNEEQDIQVLVAVSGPEDRREIKDYFLEKGRCENKDFYFFC